MKQKPNFTFLKGLISASWEQKYVILKATKLLIFKHEGALKPDLAIAVSPNLAVKELRRSDCDGHEYCF
jgi:hypothetical protein